MSITLARRGVIAAPAGPPPFPFDVPDNPTMHWGFEADRLSGNDGDAVASWTDMSPSGRTVSQATGASQPTLQAAELNGLQVVRFDGGDSLSATGWTLAQPFSVFFVAKTAVTDAVARHIMEQASGPTVLIRKQTTNTLQAAAGSTLTDDAMTTAWAMGFAVYNGASSQLGLNGATATTGNAGAASMTGLSMGRLWNGDIYALVCFAGALSSPQLNHLGNGYATKTGITWNSL